MTLGAYEGSASLRVPDPPRGSLRARRIGLASALALFAIVTGACAPAPAEGAKAGQLGNGSFLFSCDDGLACSRYSKDASTFPKTVATGATFTIRFTRNDDGIRVQESAVPADGITVSGQAPFLTTDVRGDLLAARAGFGTVFARKLDGTVLDYTIIGIAQPDEVVVYDASSDPSSGKDPARIQSVTMEVGEQRRVRAMTASKGEILAGAIPFSWSVEGPDSAVAEGERGSNRELTLIAKKAGSVTLKAEGAGLEKSIAVEVK